MPQGNAWHPTNDHLRYKYYTLTEIYDIHLNSGLAEYGVPSDDTDAAAWSIKWGLDEFNEFLFASGNLKYFLRATKKEIIGDDGWKEYADKPIQILSSYLSCDASEGVYVLTFGYKKS